MSIKSATEEQMLEQGFPEGLQTAFKATAKETQCVILSRVPGGATTALIAAGHDLKGYFIKAKSCDWGPMSGFLCQVPALNKKGVAGIKHNAEQNLYYYEKFRDRLHSPQEGLAAQDPSAAADRVKSIFLQNKLKWQNQWDNPLLWTQGDPIATTRAILKDKSDQVAVSFLLSYILEPSEKQETLPTNVFTDDESATIDKNMGLFQQRLVAVVHDLRTLVGDDSPFVPLKLTQQVFNQFKFSNPKFTQIIGDDITCGVAYKKMEEGESATLVWFKYIVKKNQQGLYGLYHGNIWIYDGKDRSLLDTFSKSILGAVKDKYRILGIPTTDSGDGFKANDLCGNHFSEVVNAIEENYKKFKGDSSFPSEPNEPTVRNELFYPIKGIQNYYPSFSGEDAYKNAVTGDYDLFACWPKIASGGLEDLTRQSELAPAPDALFSKMSSKPHSLRSTVSKNVFVEFIPTFMELETLKAAHPSFGNSNGIVNLVAGTLNSFANLGSARGGRNVAFHGDEGGRPEIDAVDYEIAAFVPKALMATGSIAKDLSANKKNAEMFIITSHAQLLTLISAVKPHCYVPLNFAWVYDFLMSENDNVKTLLKAIFCGGETENQDTKLQSLQNKFKDVFKQKNIEKSSEDKMKIVMGDGQQ
jgi:hypothetical protein